MKTLKDVPVAGAFGLKYDAEHNEFVPSSKATPKKAVNTYMNVRRPYREELNVPKSYPKNGMFSIGMRGKFIK